MRYVSTIERQGIQKGREEGRQQEGRSLVLRLLNRRIGELPESVIQQVNALSIESLEALGEALLDFRSMDDLEQWFTTYHPQQSQ
jgi:predicted transposase YdaD